MATLASNSPVKALSSDELYRPWAVAAASVVALATLAVTSHIFALPAVFALLILSSYLSHIRLGRFWDWLVRVPLFGTVVLANASDNPDSRSYYYYLFDPHYVITFGQLLAAELTVQFWKRNPEGGIRGAGTVLLAAGIFAAGCNTVMGEERHIRYFTPVFMFFLMLSFPRFNSAKRRSMDTPDSATLWRARRFRALVAVLALACGGAFAYGMFVWRSELAILAAQLLRARTQSETTGLPSMPTLGRSRDGQGSEEPILRITGPLANAHFRAAAFDTYQHGVWGPALEDVTRRSFEKATNQVLKSSATGTRLEVTRLDELPWFLGPLQTAGLDIRPQEAYWVPSDGGPIKDTVAFPAAPNTYTVIVGKDDDYQGLYCAPSKPSGHVDMARYLQVPPEIDQKILDLAEQIGGKIDDPRRRVWAVEQYLMTHHKYSLNVEPGDGDPVRDFLLNKKAAHCEYFASAATLLLRCLHVPTRFVSGYYAHEQEQDGSDTTLVRQRDAHAWAESYIDGVGWVTVEATPASGRPDRAGPISFWRRLKESLQKAYNAARDWLARLTLPELIAFTGSVLSLILLGVWLKNWLNRPPRDPLATGTYDYPNPALASLSRRFEGLLQRRGLACPQHRTWQEHLSLSRKNPAGDQLIERAERFLDRYTAVRFGCPGDKDALLQLSQLLAEMEK